MNSLVDRLLTILVLSSDRVLHQMAEYNKVATLEFTRKRKSMSVVCTPLDSGTARHAPSPSISNHYYAACIGSKCHCREKRVVLYTILSAFVFAALSPISVLFIFYTLYG